MISRMTDQDTLTGLNERFIDACRRGSWEDLSTLLAPTFRYLDGATGKLWEMDRYIEDLRQNPLPTLDIDQLMVHVDGNRAMVSARSFTRPGRYNRYLDFYERHGTSWICVNACVWPLRDPAA
jgi:hypothetical protein